MANLKTAGKFGGAVTTVAAFIALCAAYIAPHEGVVHHAYRDSGGTWTICYGHTKDVHEGMAADDQQCKAWLDEDTAVAVNGLDALTLGVQWPSPDYKKVFVDQVFNSGAGSLKGTRMLIYVKYGDFDGACHEFVNWYKMKVPVGSAKDMLDGKADGHADCRIKKADCGGLPNRRKQQEADCLKALQN